MLEETIPSSGVIEMMSESGALLQGHFQLTSGLHSAQYIQCALLLEDPGRAQRSGELLRRVLEDVLGESRPGVVVSPAVGGIVIGHEVARAMGARSIFAERVAGRMTLRRGFKIDRGETAVVVEDVFTTGGSIREVMQVVEGSGGEVLAVASIVNRSRGADFGVPAVSLVRADIENHDPQDCPLCRDGSVAVKPGSRDIQGKPA
jgi:orotate phosphoribosyltransferase